jgi:hypothetical protein
MSGLDKVGGLFIRASMSVGGGCVVDSVSEEAAKVAAFVMAGVSLIAGYPT